MDPQRPFHRRAVSSPHPPTRNDLFSTPDSLSSSHQPRPTTASRVLLSVKRSLTSSSSSAQKKRFPDYSKGMHSTYEELHAPPPQQFRTPDPMACRPTIEQIAMGLHVSRTPHLRPLGTSYAYSQGTSASHPSNPYEHHQHRETPVVLPPPPTRSSMKKPPTTSASSCSSPFISPPISSSSTPATSAAPSPAQSSRSFAAIKFRMARLLPNSRVASAPSSIMSSPVSSPRNSVSDFSRTTKKAVRFTTEEEMDGD